MALPSADPGCVSPLTSPVASRWPQALVGALPTSGLFFYACIIPQLYKIAKFGDGPLTASQSLTGSVQALELQPALPYAQGHNGDDDQQQQEDNGTFT
jgi:hypothetical protein